MDLGKDIKSLVLDSMSITELEEVIDSKAKVFDKPRKVDKNSYEYKCNYYRKLIEPRFEKCD